MTSGDLGQTDGLAVQLCSRRRTRGFSLVELLLATSVILILLAIMLPALKRSIRQARTTVCMHHLRVLDQLLQMYHTENRGWLPVPSEDDLAPCQSQPAWFDLLVPRYAADLAVMVCPEDPYGTFLHVANPEVPKYYQQRASSYGLNGFILASPQGMLASVEHRRAKRPLDTLFLADMGPDRGSKKNPSSMPGLAGGAPGYGCLSWSDGFGYDSVDPYQSWVTQRHARGINVLTMGGAVRLVPTKELMSRTIRDFYEPCAAGECPLCLELHLPHYSFYHAQTYWWTGSIPKP